VTRRWIKPIAPYSLGVALESSSPRPTANSGDTFSEFPSLSGAPQQSQSQNPGQLVWANASQRAAQHTPVQRQQPPSQSPSRASQTQSHPTQQQSQPPHDDMFPSGAQFANRLDDFRNGGQGISSQLGAGGQPQTGNIDEFPPLGRNVAAELGQDRRTSLMQNGGFGSYNSSKTVATKTTERRNEWLTRYPGIGTSRSPGNQGPNGVLGQEKEVSRSAIMFQGPALTDTAGLEQHPHVGATQLQRPATTIAAKAAAGYRGTRGFGRRSKCGAAASRADE